MKLHLDDKRGIAVIGLISRSRQWKYLPERALQLQVQATLRDEPAKQQCLQALGASFPGTSKDLTYLISQAEYGSNSWSKRAGLHENGVSPSLNRQTINAEIILLRL